MGITRTALHVFPNLRPEEWAAGVVDAPFDKKKLRTRNHNNVIMLKYRSLSTFQGVLHEIDIVVEFVRVQGCWVLRFPILASCAPLSEEGC